MKCFVRTGDRQVGPMVWSMLSVVMSGVLGCSDYGFVEPTDPALAGHEQHSADPLMYIDILETTAAGSDDPSPVDTADTGDACQDGYTGWFYNLPADHPDMEQDPTGVLEGDMPTAHDWYDPQYLAFTRHDPGLDFGTGWWPVDEGLPGDPQYFSVRWEAWLEVDEDTPAAFQMGSDDDSWAFIDGQLVADLGGIHAVEETWFVVELSEGLHRLEIYMAERHTSGAGFWFVWATQSVRVFTCPE